MDAVAKSCMLFNELGENGGQEDLELLQAILFLAPICIQDSDGVVQTQGVSRSGQLLEEPYDIRLGLPDCMGGRYLACVVQNFP